MSRSHALKFGAGLAALLALWGVSVLSSPAHDEEESQVAPLPDDGPGPREGQPVAMPPGLIGLEIAFGLDETRRAEWTGEIKVSEGRVAELEVLRSGPGARVEGTRFTLESAKVKKAAQQKKKKAQAKKKQGADAIGPVLRVSLDAPPSAKVTLATDRGNVEFAPADLTRGKPQRFLDGEVSVERQDAAVRLTGRGTEDDYPVAAKGADGSIWLAYVEYHAGSGGLESSGRQPKAKVAPTEKDFDRLVPKDNGDRIRLRRFDGKSWQAPLDVTGARLDVWRPTIAIDGKGVIWVAWAQQVDGDWDIYRRGYTPPGDEGGQGRWTDVIQVTRDKESDFHVVAATDSKGTVWLAWQAWRDGQYDILAASLADDGPGQEPRRISTSKANDWSPAIAADKGGNVYVAWDTYDQGQYDVLLRRLGRDDEPMKVAASPRFEARPSLACDDKGRLWIAYEVGDEQWGKDYSSGQAQRVPLKNLGYALYINRTVQVKCLEGGKLKRPAAALESALDAELKRNKSVPRLALDPDGGLWLLFRHATLPGGAGETWSGFATRYDGQAWSPPRRLPVSTNLMDNRPALAPHGKGLLAVYSSDKRTNTQNRGQDDLYAALLLPDRAATQAPELADDEPAGKADVPTVHPDEKADIARMRDYRVEAGGKSLRLLRGEFHRHTEFSSHNDQDGLLEDTWRYALDAANHDWMGNGDHDNGFGHEYMWWLIQKSADLHLNPGFVAVQSYERSVVYPNGHRNVIMPRRGIRPLPRGGLPGTAEEGAPDTKLLYAYLKHFGGMCASHTSATDMGTDWRDNDPLVEPVVEIYQGHRHNYEHLGAPRAPTEATQIGGYQPAGFVWNALERGYRLGFQSSSDHVSTHWSYAVVLAEFPSRPAIIDAFKRRHCYAATDNIILDVRSGDHLMGDAFETGRRPTLEIAAHGTSPVAKLHVIRDNKYVFSTEPNDRTVKLKYTDDDQDLKPGTHYYYVRIQQADGNLAWASPLWITYKP
jgi:hypothetical protein